jgi:hypothetical protein
MKFYVLRLVDWLPNAVRQTNQPKHVTIDVGHRRQSSMEA